MAINWARGLDELGTGLLRQADIGNRAYEGAMAKEAETRAESRALSAERRALQQRIDAEARLETATIKQEGRREGAIKRGEVRAEATAKRKEGREDITFTQRLGEEGQARLDLEDKMIDKRHVAWKKQYDIEMVDKKAAAKNKAQISTLEKIYDETMAAFRELTKAFGDKPESPGFKLAYRAQINAQAAWNELRAASGLKMRENPEIERLRLRIVQAVYAEIVSADLQQDGPFKDFITSLGEYGPGGEPNKALEDAMISIVATPIYIPTSSVGGFPFLNTLCSIYYL